MNHRLLYKLFSLNVPYAKLNTFIQSYKRRVSLTPYTVSIKVFSTRLNITAPMKSTTSMNAAL